MGKTLKSCPPESREQIIAPSRAGRSAAELVREFDPSEQTIRNWLFQAQVDTCERSDGLTRDEKAELGRLRKENRRLREEREIFLKNSRVIRRGDRLNAHGTFELIAANRSHHRVTTMCEVLGVSPSGFYAWLGRESSSRMCHDEQRVGAKRTIHAESRGTSGVPRVHVELREVHDERVGRKRVAWLMRREGLQGASRRKSNPGGRTSLPSVTGFDGLRFRGPVWDDAVAFEPSIECRRSNPEIPGGQHLVSTVQLQRGQNVFPLNLRESPNLAACDNRPVEGFANFLRKIIDFDAAATSKHNRTLHGVRKFSDVPRPSVAQQFVRRRRG